jgi:glycosyltransferase involved in cell wall biosynthesis
MACGLPVISTRFGGAAEDIIQDGENGLLVPPADPKALADAMLKLMLDPAARTRLGSQATGVVQRFSTERVLALWDEAMNRAMSRRPGKAHASGMTLPARKT